MAFPVKKAPSGKAEEGAAQPITTEIQVLRLGDIYVLGLPGEILVEVGMEIRKKAGVEKLLIATVTNDAIGYVCHSLAYDEGGYEPGAATNLAKGAGEIMVSEAVALLEEIKKASPEESFGVYMKNRKVYGDSPAFFLDCADYFYNQKRS